MVSSSRRSIDNHSRKKTTRQLFFVLFTRSVSPSGIYGTLLLPLTNAANDNSKNKTLFAVLLEGIRVCSRRIDRRLSSRVAKCDLAKSRFYFARRTGAESCFWSLYDGQFNDQWVAYRQLQRRLSLQPRAVHHSLHFVDPVTGIHTQHAESNWCTAKEKFKLMKGNTNPARIYVEEMVWRSSPKLMFSKIITGRCKPTPALYTGQGTSCKLKTCCK